MRLNKLLVGKQAAQWLVYVIRAAVGYRWSEIDSEKLYNHKKRGCLSFSACTCKNMDVILQARDHVLLLHWSDASTGVNHHHVQPRETFGALDGRAAGVPRRT